MAWIKDDLVPTEPIEFEKLPKYKPDYEHVRCECGGIIGAYSCDDYFTCEKCDKIFKVWQLEYDSLKINDKTGWIFPVIMRREFE